MKVDTKLKLIVTLVTFAFLSPTFLFAQEDRFAEAINTSRKAVKEMLATSQTPGCQVAVSVDGKLVWSEGFGLANLEAKEKVDTNTRFGIGSISKSLTTAALLKLHDERRLEIGLPIKTYFPDFPHDKNGITPRSIAAHLSGLDDAFGGANRYCNQRFKTTKDALKEIYREKLVCSPGSEHNYATSSYTLLAGVIEQATGQEFLPAIQELVFDPLELSTIVANQTEANHTNTTEFYELENAKIIKAKYFDPSYKMAGAGFLATASDLVRFTDKIVHSEFLTPLSRQIIFTDHETNAGSATGFGLGWRIDKDDRGRLLYHQPGGGPGISTWAFHFPKQKLSVAILANLTVAPVGGKAGNTVIDSFLDVIDPIQESKESQK